MNAAMDVGVHVDAETTVEAQSHGSTDWLKIGEGVGKVSVFFHDDADVSRMILKLEILRHRMRERAHLPVADPVDSVAESLDREQVEVGHG